MSDPHDLDDDYPTGWLLTYRTRGPDSSPGTGVVAGPGIQDPATGVLFIPVAEHGTPRPRIAWIADTDVIGITPLPG
ncbi:hypothetical protein ACFXPA_48125 [Amycolatopsis sp. NPDC059090]|uniref:hypothetical protein n=1 Tax=Amycolatopsis sp. NPDC059090 TaxID=3346723 RepID=UPI00366E485E